MLRPISLLVLLLGLCGFVCTACAREPEITDPAAAAKRPRFQDSGRIRGRGNLARWQPCESPRPGDCLGQRPVHRGGHQGRFAGRWLATRSAATDAQGHAGEGDHRTVGCRVSGKILDRRGKIDWRTDRQKKAGGDNQGNGDPGNDGKMKLNAADRPSQSDRSAKPPEGAVVLFDGTTAKNFSPAHCCRTETCCRRRPASKVSATTRCTWSSACLHAGSPRPGAEQQRRLLARLLRDPGARLVRSGGQGRRVRRLLQACASRT